MKHHIIFLCLVLSLGLFWRTVSAQQDLTANFYVTLADATNQARATFELENPDTESREVYVAAVLTDKLFPHRNTAQEQRLTLDAGERKTVRMDFPYPWFGWAVFVPVASYDYHGITGHVRLDQVTKFAVPARALLRMLMALLALNMAWLVIRMAMDGYRSMVLRRASKDTVREGAFASRLLSEKSATTAVLRLMVGVAAIVLVAGGGLWVAKLRALQKPQLTVQSVVTEHQPEPVQEPKEPEPPQPEPLAREVFAVDVFNANGLRGVAGAFAATLKSAGFTDITPDNADRFDYTETEVRYHTEAALLEAQAIADLAKASGYEPITLDDATLASTTLRVFLGARSSAP